MRRVPARIFLLVGLVAMLAAAQSVAAPYAAMVIDGRSGKVLHSRNADTRLHPASLTKMMTLYIAFEAVQNGELTMDTKVTISRKAAAEPPSKLGLRAGQQIALRYLVRAAAVRSANDAATAIGEAISGSEAAFARRMNRTAKALGMTSTTFKNAHGLTQAGHLSTARDMTTMGRALFYHYPQYYNIFSRRTTDAGVKPVSNTNRKFLSQYRGADGIKTGYTRAAGFNLVASADRGGERIIATVFGGNSTASRNARMVELLNMGFDRAPRRVAVNPPPRPAYRGTGSACPDCMAGKTVRANMRLTTSLRPVLRPRPVAPSPDVLIAMEAGIAEAVSAAAEPAQDADTALAAAPLPTPEPRPDTLAIPAPDAESAARPENPDADAIVAAEAVAADDPVLRLAQAPDGMRSRPAPRPRATGPEDMTPAAEVARAVPDLPLIAQRATDPGLRPRPRPAQVQAALPTKAPEAPPPLPTRVITRATNATGAEAWLVSLGAYPTRFAAEQALVEASMREMSVLTGARREIVQRSRGWIAQFGNLSEGQAQRTCGRIAARGAVCEIQPSG